MWTVLILCVLNRRHIVFNGSRKMLAIPVHNVEIGMRENEMEYRMIGLASSADIIH